jgi:tRNA threonylcarbamoyladenosine biosynthesis protein TsaE
MVASKGSKMSMTSYKTNAESETFALGEALGRDLSCGMNVLFYGDLGAGKTAMIRGLCSALGVDVSTVHSPTFNIVNEYSTADSLRIFHIDAYRLTPDDFIIGGFDEYLSMDNSICLIEWAENLPETKEVMSVRISGSGEEERNIDVVALS